MLAKAILLNRDIRIQERREPKTISFEKCLNLLDRSGAKALDDDSKLSLTALSNVRGAAQHALVEVSEQQLFLHAQTAVTIFDRLLSQEFDAKLADFLPTRVLPISTEPPKSIELMVDSEIEQIRQLLKPGMRRTHRAKDKLRSLLSLDLAAADQHRGPTPLEVDRAASRLKGTRAWSEVLPNLASLSLDSTGTGQTFTVRITRDKNAPPARFAETEDESENAAIIREVDLTERYPFRITELAKLCGLSVPKAGALAWYLELEDDAACVHEFRHGKSVFRQYSHKALRVMRDGVASADIAEIWRSFRSRD